MILALMILLLAGDPLVKSPDVYTDPSGWSVASVKPTTDLTRWGKFENGMNTCPVCMQQAEARGMFRTYRKFWMDGAYRWYAFALDIPSGMGLIFDEESTLQAISSDGDTTTSEYMTFPVGWDPWPQHAELTTRGGAVYVHPPAFGDGPTSEDYEWVRFRSEMDDLPKYYVLGYARFDPLPKGETSWRITGVTPYRR